MHPLIMPNSSDHLVQLILLYKYPIIVLITIIEGPVAMMLAGFLLKLGYLSFIPTYFSLMAGDLIGDTWWYGVGYFAGVPFIARFGKFFSITEDSVAKVKRIFHKYKNSILFISKITMGFGLALVTLITAGLVKIPFKRYILINFLGQFVWTVFLLGVGYFFGNFYMKADNLLGKFFIAGLLVIAIAALIGLGKYFGRQFIKRNA